MIDECNRLREGEGLEPLKVSETALAMAMVQANFAANGNYFHNRQYDNAGENLDWNGEDANPYDDWYTEEKAAYQDAIKSGQYPGLENMSVNEVIKTYPELANKVGHYLNVINPDYVSTGTAYSGYGEGYYENAYSQEFMSKNWNVYADKDTTYDAATYRKMVEQYVSSIRNAQSNYENAVKAMNDAKNALDKANTAKADAANTLAAAKAAKATAQTDAARTADLLEQATADADAKAKQQKQANDSKSPTKSAQSR